MKLLIFDGNSIINRAFYGVRPLVNSKGIHTNALYGFINTLLRFIDEEKPELICCAFDMRVPTFRKQMYDKYKAHRKGMPEELAQQMPLLKNMLSAMNIKILELEGYEADDIIGTVATRCSESNIKCIIATGDKDELQLIDDNITVKLIVTRNGAPEITAYNPEKINEVYGVKPAQLIDVKAFMGDTSDNIPGVQGVGEKTALDLIVKYNNLEYVYDNIETLDIKESLKNKLINSKDDALLSRKLAEIYTKVPIDGDIKEFTLNNHINEALAAVLTDFEFKSLLKRLGLSAVVSQANIHEAEPAPEVKINIRQAKPEEIANKIKNEMYFLFNDKTNEFMLLCEGEILSCSLLVQDYDSQLSFDTKKPSVFVDALYKKISDKSIKKYTDNVKPFALFLLKQNIKLDNICFDTALAGYLLNPSASVYDYKMLTAMYCKWEISEPNEFLSILPLLTENLKSEIENNGLNKLYYEIELPLSIILASMECYGFMVDKQALIDFSKFLNTEIETLTASIYKIADGEFNINSTKQLGEILFDKLSLPIIKKTKTGYSTDAEVLTALSGMHEIIADLLKYRQYAKLKSTYADALLKLIGDDNRIHSTFQQFATQTGRISSTEPNLQNIPIRDELGARVRSMFIAQQGMCLLDADYSQIELRVLADIADDETMKEAFSNNEDIHTKTAAKVFGLTDDMITPQLRKRAKAVNFGIVYGIGDYSLAQDLNITRAEAKQYIDDYLNNFASVKKYMDDITTFAKEKGYVTTLSGRKRYIPEINASNKNIQAFGRRVALNTPIQGTAADIIKIAMVKVYNKLSEGGYKARLILQVHDELVLECPLDEVDEVSKILKYEMENALELSVPLYVEVGSGENWQKAK